MATTSGRARILGMEWPYFIMLFTVVNLAMFFDFLPSSLAGMIPLLLVYGEGLKFVGDRLPIVKDYLGGGSVVILFGCAALVMFGIIPEETATEAKTFMVDNFINYALAALCCGSIFGMDRNLLLRAAVRYIPCIFGGVALALLMAGGVGAMTGFGFSDAILYIALPIMGGGTSAGAVPMSQMFSEVLGRDAGEMLAIMTPAVALGNACAIVAGGLLNKLGKASPSMTGNGAIMRDSSEEEIVELKKNAEPITDISVFATGMAVAGVFLGLGQLIHKSMFPSVHAYAWMILLMIIVKTTGIMPESIEKSCALWYKFFIKNFASVLLAGLGMGMISLSAVMAAFTPTYLILVIVVIVGAVLGSGLVGYMCGFYPIEAAITGGLCMANMGGSGDIATLGACDRMELMPFAAISSRLGGALILILGSFLLSFFA